MKNAWRTNWEWMCAKELLPELKCDLWIIPRWLWFYFVLWSLSLDSMAVKVEWCNSSIIWLFGMSFWQCHWLWHQGPGKKASSNKNLGLQHLKCKKIFGRGLQTCNLGRIVVPSTIRAKSFTVYAGMWSVIINFYPTWI